MFCIALLTDETLILLESFLYLIIDILSGVSELEEKMGGDHQKWSCKSIFQICWNKHVEYPFDARLIHMVEQKGDIDPIKTVWKRVTLNNFNPGCSLWNSAVYFEVKHL